MENNILNKMKLTKLLLIDYLFRFSAYEIRIYFRLIKYLFDKKLIETDLTKFGHFNISCYTFDIDIIKWFDENFIMKWDKFEMKSWHSSKTYNDIFQVFLKSWCELNTETIKYVIDKKYMNVSDEYICEIFEFFLYDTGAYSPVRNLLRLYKYLLSINGRPDKLSKIWNEYINELLICNDIFDIEQFSIIVGLILNEIKILPLGIIRRYKITQKNIKKFLFNRYSFTLRNRYDEDSKYIDKYIKENNIHPMCVFIEDLQQINSNLTLNELKIKYPFLKYERYQEYLISKQDCINERNLINKYIDKIRDNII
jgi:hypothetical protein